MIQTNLYYLFYMQSEKKCLEKIVIVDLNEFIKYDFIGKSDYVLYFVHDYYYVNSSTFKHFMNVYDYFNSIKGGVVYD